jgi:glucose/arabinose dehydrogenase/PKD repeat protein
MILRDQGGISSIVPLPDGGVVASTLYGYLTLIRDAQQPSTILELPDIVTTDEHGVEGLCIDPGFSDNGWFYIYYTGPGPYNLVARYTLVNDAVDPASRTIIWQNPDLCPGASHQGGGIQFGIDGNLYIATGDQYDVPSNGQNLSNQHGKILRLAPDGSIPPDNPFLNTPGAQAAIWAYGLRNPFRITTDAATGNLWIGDVGESTWEEIDRVPVGPPGGANFGWPLMEGPQCNTSSCAGFTGPLWWYAHGDPVFTPNWEAAVMCGPIYRGNAFPAEYRGNLFYADYPNGWIKRLTFDQTGAVTGDIVFDSAPSSKWIADLKQGFDGALYYAIVQDNEVTLAGVYKIAASTPGNTPPTVVAGASPRQGAAPLTVNFDSTGTIDPDNGPQPLSYLWTFGDGQTSTQPSPAHEYSTRGYYQTSLTVTDGADPVTSDPIFITVGHAPVPQITQPGTSFQYAAGDTINFAGIATDVEDGTLPASAFTWSFALVHLSHIHPFLTPISGVQSGSFVIPTTGHDPENTHYRITLTVVDSDQTPASVSLDLVPRPSVILLDTTPSGIPLFLDGRAIATPETYTSLINFQHQITAQPTFSLDGTPYDFQSWSSGQPATFSFTAPDGGLSLTADYAIACYANCDQSTVPPILNANDFECFLNKWAAGDPYANCDQSTFPPVLNANDFQCFLNAYAAGCT